MVIAVTKRGVDLFDVFVGHAFGMQERAQNFIGGARINVVGTQQHKALGAAAVFAHQIFNRRDRLLVGRCAGVEDVRRHFFAFVLHRVEQQAVEFFKYRQHGLARHRGPATEHRRDFVLSQQLPAFFREQWPVGRRVDDHRFKHFSVDPAFGVDLVDGHQRHVFERGFGDRHGSGQGVQNPDLDRFGGLQGPGHAQGCNGCREGKSFDQVTTLHGAISRNVMFISGRYGR